MEPYLLLPLYLLQAVWFIAPGILGALWLHKKKVIIDQYVVLTAGLLSSIVAYLAFWTYFRNIPKGEALTWLSAGVSLIAALKYARSKKMRRLLGGAEIAAPLVLWLITGFLYSSVLMGCAVDSREIVPAKACNVFYTDIDNFLPKLTAENVLAREPKKPIGDWRSSDRPPLQTGAVLLQSPLTVSPEYGKMSYQLLSTFLQVMWVPAIWLLARNIGLGGKRLVLVFGLCLCSGFFYFNSVYVWPKLFASSLAALGISLALFTRPTKQRWLLAGAAFGAAMVAHSAVAFTLIPFGLLLLWPRYFPGLAPAFCGAIGAALLFLPWMAYQKLYDPPGNRLIKWQIGGVIPIDERGAKQTIIDSYQAAGAKGTVANKLANFGELFNLQGSSGVYGHNLRSNNFISDWRDMEFYLVFFALNMLNFGWAGLLFRSVRQRLAGAGVDVGRLATLLGLGAAALVVWAVLMFGPGTTVVHQGSHLTMMLLFIPLAAAVTALPRYLAAAVIINQLCLFLYIWIIDLYLVGNIQWRYVAWLVVALAVMAWWLKHLSPKFYSKHRKRYNATEDTGQVV